MRPADLAVSNPMSFAHMRFAVIVIVLVVCVAMPAQAGPKTSGLPVPRFVSLRADKVNMRAGPGFQYPVEWVYRRRGMPMEVIAEYRGWRKVRDWQGTQGWIHKKLLSSRRRVVVTGKLRTLRAGVNPDSPPMARLEAGVIGELVGCPDLGSACRIRVGGYEGWLERSAFWGAHKEERLD